MKLTRNELLRATDKQLQTIGCKRFGNSGWMQKALDTDFSAVQMSNFYAAGKDRPERPVKPWLLSLIDPNGKRHEITAYSREGLVAEIRSLLTRI